MNISIKVENQPKFDIFKWLLVGILIVGGIAANNYLVSQSAALRLAGWLVLACVAILIAFQTRQGRHVWSFIQDARMELRKVTWPTRQEVVQTTLLVVAMVVVTSLFLWAVDSFLLWVIGFLTGQRG